MKTTYVAKLTTLAVTALAVACAQPPEDSITAARTALQQAVTAEAPEYAPDSFNAAQDAVASMDAELSAQQERFALIRSYDKATQLAAGARTAAEQSVSAAGAARELAQQEARLAVEALRASVEEVKLLLEQAPKGKGTAADLEAMTADLAGIESSIGEIDESLGNGRFKEATLKARASLESAGAIKAEIVAAVEARKAGRRRS